MVSFGIVAGAGGWVAERLIGLIDQLGAGFGFSVQRGRMHKPIGMPHLHLFMPGALNLNVRRVGAKFQDGVVVGGASVLHRCPCAIEV
jgi:hypothetical protein